MRKLCCLFFSILLILSFTVGCGDNGPDVYVLDELSEDPMFTSMVDAFEKETGKDLKIEPLSSPELLRLIQSDEYNSAFFIMTPELEAELANHEVVINEIYYDPIYLIGPKEDKIGLGQLSDYSADMVLKHIVLTGNPFIHGAELTNLRKKEVKFWEDNGIIPDPDLYIEAESGVDGILKSTAKHEGYAAVERYVYEAYKSKYPTLTVLQDKCDGLIDRFCMVVKSEDADSMANRFTNWMMDAPGQDLIYFYGMEEYGVSRYLPSVH